MYENGAEEIRIYWKLITEIDCLLKNVILWEINYFSEVTVELYMYKLIFGVALIIYIYYYILLNNLRFFLGYIQIATEFVGKYYV